MNQTDSQLSKALATLAADLGAAGRFGPVTLGDSRLECAALGASSPASYRVELDQGRVFVSLVTPDRWLSQSIEQDLMNTGDRIEELLDEELAELDHVGQPPVVEHFRSDDKLYTFRSPLTLSPQSLGDPGALAIVRRYLLAYEACFRVLGDMEGDDQ
ncbi:MAG: hypothetical protein AABZ53_08830 [Planctomycetota bacterium]